ncbi:MAG: right-handed parallel beta-helix repeat-containing protein, partial [Phycisphaerales bacterium]
GSIGTSGDLTGHGIECPCDCGDEQPDFLDDNIHFYDEMVNCDGVHVDCMDVDPQNDIPDGCQTVLRVDRLAPCDTCSGGTWGGAFHTLREALEAAAENAAGVWNVEIWVAEGTYTPSGIAGRENTFTLHDGVTIYGGFANHETCTTEGCERERLADRDWAKYPTILSGDRDGNDEGNLLHSSRLDNSCHVLTCTNTTPYGELRTILDGFTIIGGNADADCAKQFGGGLLISPEAESRALPTIRNCRFLGNYANGCGGGVYVDGDAGATLVNCTFNGNLDPSGGGAYIANGGAVTIANCTFGMRGGSAGEAVVNRGTVSIVNSILWRSDDNRALDGSSSTSTMTEYSNILEWSDGEHNINEDPLFVDLEGPDGMPGTLDDDLRLLATSRCIDAGNNEADAEAFVPGINPLPEVD